MDLNKLVLWAALFSALMTAVSFLRDLMNIVLPIPSWLSSKRFWLATFVIVLCAYSMGLFMQNRNLNNEIKLREQEIAKLQEAQAAQQSEIVAKDVAQATLIAENEQLNNQKSSIDGLKTQLCDQIKIIASPESISFNKDFVGIDYELSAPSETGVRVLLHSGEIIANNGPIPTIIASGTNAADFDVYVPSGKTRHLDGEGVYLTEENLADAKTLGTMSVIERKTFHLSLDNGLYCAKYVDVFVRIEQT